MDWAASATDLLGRRWSALADADADGDPDLYLALRDEEAVQVLLNDGSGGFGVGERRAAPADLVDNQDVSAAEVARGGGLVAWWLNTTFDAATIESWRDTDAGFVALPIQTPNASGYAGVQDVDRDGVMDLVGGWGDRAAVQWGIVERTNGACE